jgi:hypothetical protein
MYYPPNQVTLDDEDLIQIHPKVGKSSRLGLRQLRSSDHRLLVGNGSLGEGPFCRQKRPSTSACPLRMLMREYCQCDCRRIQLAARRGSATACAASGLGTMYLDAGEYQTKKHQALSA